jgi:putative phosphoesterase
MLHIGILSDTHGFIHPRVLEFFSGMDEIWHAGDIGTPEVAGKLAAISSLRAVHGNIDGRDIRMTHPETLLFRVEQVKVLMMHIGGYPGRYDSRARSLIGQEKPDLFVCGHSHILKVIYDNKYNLLHINPGAAGMYGMHKSITAVKLIIEGENMHNLEILDIPRK